MFDHHLTLLGAPTPICQALLGGVLIGFVGLSKVRLHCLSNKKSHPAMPCKNIIMGEMSQWGNCLFVVMVAEMSVGGYEVVSMS